MPACDVIGRKSLVDGRSAVRRAGQVRAVRPPSPRFRQIVRRQAQQPANWIADVAQGSHASSCSFDQRNEYVHRLEDHPTDAAGPCQLPVTRAQRSVGEGTSARRGAVIKGRMRLARRPWGPRELVGDPARTRLMSRRCRLTSLRRVQPARSTNLTRSPQ
jgi:hypothetical protein